MHVLLYNKDLTHIFCLNSNVVNNETRIKTNLHIMSSKDLIHSTCSAI